MRRKAEQLRLAIEEGDIPRVVKLHKEITTQTIVDEILRDKNDLQNKDIVRKLAVEMEITDVLRLAGTTGEGGSVEFTRLLNDKDFWREKIKHDFGKYVNIFEDDNTMLKYLNLRYEFTQLMGHLLGIFGEEDFMIYIDNVGNPKYLHLNFKTDTTTISKRLIPQITFGVEIGWRLTDDPTIRHTNIYTFDKVMEYFYHEKTLDALWDKIDGEKALKSLRSVDVSKSQRKMGLIHILTTRLYFKFDFNSNPTKNKYNIFIQKVEKMVIDQKMANY